MAKGTKLGASELGVLATVGRPKFSVYRFVRTFMKHHHHIYDS